MKNATEDEYPKMVFLNYSNFHFELSDYELKLLKIFFLRILQKINTKVFYLKSKLSNVHLRNV